MQRRSLDELLDPDDPAWPLVQDWVASATHEVELLPSVETDRGAELIELQVTTRSPMGALAYETGGILVDGGWLRVLGSGHGKLPRALGSWNREQASGAGYLLIADDVAGGFFALNGGALEGEAGHTHYLAPDTGTWEDMGASYSEFLNWALSGDHDRFYAELRWPSWREDTAQLTGDRAFHFVPPLWAKGPPIGERDRRDVPVAELLGLLRHFGEAFGG